MKLCCISDTHGQHKQLNLSPYSDCDVLIHAGDWTRSRIHYESEAADFVDWLEAQPFKHKLLIAGNHDFYPAEYPGRFKYMCDKRGIYYLQDSSITIEGINFYGSPWTPPFYDWAFMANEIKLEEHYDTIPDGTDVLITHGPPHNILDKTLEGFHAGSFALTEATKRLDLKTHVFGHIHEGYGRKGLSINCSMVTRDHRMTHQPIIVEI